MVDGISSAASGSNGYAPYQSSGRQTSTITVETEEQTLTAQIKQGGKVETLSYASYSQAVTINIKTGPNGPGVSSAASAQLQDGQQALATVEQTAAEASDFLKNDAKQKLQIALNELKLLKLLGQTPAGAKEAAQLAKQIADAASEYAAGGGADPADSADASTAAGDAADATDGTAATGSDGTAASATATPSSAATAAASSSTTAATGTAGTSSTAATGSTAQAASSNGLTPADQDPFFQEVQAALKELKKYLQKTLPALEASPDEKTRKLARKVEKSFNESVAQIASAEAQFNTESALGAADDTTALGGADSAASAAASIVAGVYQPVNISV